MLCTTISLKSSVEGAVLAYSDPVRLEMRIPADPGLYHMSLVTRDDTFDVDTCNLSLLEWPSQKTVSAGPFDFDHTNYRMAVPVFRVAVDDADCGLVWCEVPSPEDLQARRVRATWAVQFGAAGEHCIRLEVPENDRYRLRWTDVAEICLQPDDREILPFDVAASPHPRLFAVGEGFQRLQRHRDQVQQAMLDNIAERAARHEDHTYGYLTVMQALVGRLNNDAQSTAAAIERTMALCARENWGYHDVPEIMGWNNDRDTGMRMFETAIVYDWLYEQLTGEQRETMRSKLAYHAEIAARTTLLQRGYWYYRTCEAHGFGYWFGFAAAAGALLDEDDRARDWLTWIHSNIVDGLTHMPDDGIVEWPVFNPYWGVMTAAVLESLLGKRLAVEIPFLRGFADNIIPFSGTHGGSPMLRTMLIYLAARFQDARCQADALRQPRPGKGVNFEPLALLLYDPSLTPSELSAIPDMFAAENGTVICRDTAGKTSFQFQCGVPLTPAKHDANNWINRAWYSCAHMGSYSWRRGRKRIVPERIKGYRHLTAEANLITVDGGGSRLDGRWVGYAIPSAHAAEIETVAHKDGITECIGNAAPSYASAGGVTEARRRWRFDHGQGVLVMHDTFRTNAPRQLAWHIHTPLVWREVEEGHFVAVADGEEVFAVRVVHSSTAFAADVETVQFVPSYTFGVNCYKTLDWQPELRPQELNIPTYLDLQFAPVQPVAAWELTVVMGPDPEAVVQAAEGIADSGFEAPRNRPIGAGP